MYIFFSAQVDLVFEQDKGFWAAVQSFMSTTKIPIVLTSNDVKLNTKFEGRFEHYTFKIPPMVIKLFSYVNEKQRKKDHKIGLH